MLDWTKELIDGAMEEYQPYAIVCMVSGGRDSMAAYHAARVLGVPITHILHGVTNTGVMETTEFVREWASTQDAKYIEANAGDSYEQYVRRKGFFGVGGRAHTYAYHVLKHMPFNSTVSREIRHRKRGRNVLLLNGARREESVNRAKNFENPIKVDLHTRSNIWINLLNEWTKEERDKLLEEVGSPINPVTAKLCRSGECLCGTMQSKATREEVAFYYPRWGEWIDALEREAIEKHGFGWGEGKPRQRDLAQGDLFQPMCNDCLLQQENSSESPT